MLAWEISVLELQHPLTQVVKSWKDMTNNQRHAYSSYEQAPVSSFDPTTGKKMVKLDYGKKLNIPEGVSMPITVFLVGYETGYSFPDRELFTFEGVEDDK